MKKEIKRWIKSGSYIYIYNSKIRSNLYYRGLWASLVAQLVKNLPAMQETCVQSLGQEDPLEKDMATHSRILAWRITMDGGVWQAAVHEVRRAGHG